MTYKELTEKMSKENLSQMEGSDEMLRSAEGADMELAIDDLGLIAGGGGSMGLTPYICKKCGGKVYSVNMVLLRCSNCGVLKPGDVDKTPDVGIE